MHRDTLSATAIIATLAILAGFGCAPASAGAPPQAPATPPQPVEPLLIPDTHMVLDRPADWWSGGIRGPTVLLSYIGRPDGYPAFAVHTDPESRIETDLHADRAIQELFDSIVASREENQVLFADWVQINSLRVHSSLMAFPSVAGPVSVRRVLLMHDKQPYILSWSTRAADYPEIEELVEWCVASLRLVAGPTVAGLGAR